MKRLLPENIFNSEDLGKDLARKSVRGGAATMTAQGIQLALNLVGTMVLARLLTPKDYGLIGMVLVVVNFAAMFKDAGLSMATVQKDKISHEQISTLFWINVLISAFLGLCVLFSSPLIAWFYGKPELTAVTAALSISFVITGLTIQHSALLRRHMQFGALAFIQIASYLLNIIVAIILALAGFRYWALVGGTIALSISGTLLTLFFCPWMPRGIKKGTGVRKMLLFGGHLSGFNFLDYFVKNVDYILIGKFIGTEGLGLYTKAYQLFEMPISQIRGPLTQVAMPVLSSLQNQPKRYVKYYQRLINVLASLTIPLTLYCAIEADFLIRIFLGQQWLGAVSVFRILAIAALIQPVATTRGLVLLSNGYSKRFFHFGIVYSIIRILSIVAGIPFGIEGIAIGHTVGIYITLVPSLFYCFHRTHITVSLFIKTIILPLLLSLMTSVCVIYIQYLIKKDSIISHVVYATIFIIIYSTLSWCRQSIREMFNLFNKGMSIIPSKTTKMKHI